MRQHVEEEQQAGEEEGHREAFPQPPAHWAGRSSAVLGAGAETRGGLGAGRKGRRGGGRGDLGEPAVPVTVDVVVGTVGLRLVERLV